MREDFKQQMEEELKYVDVTLTDRQIVAVLQIL